MKKTFILLLALFLFTSTFSQTSKFKDKPLNYNFIIKIVNGNINSVPKHCEVNGYFQYEVSIEDEGLRETYLKTSDYYNLLRVFYSEYNVVLGFCIDNVCKKDYVNYLKNKGYKFNRSYFGYTEYINNKYSFTFKMDVVDNKVVYNVLVENYIKKEKYKQNIKRIEDSIQRQKVYIDSLNKICDSLIEQGIYNYNNKKNKSAYINFKNSLKYTDFNNKEKEIQHYLLKIENRQQFLEERNKIWYSYKAYEVPRKLHETIYKEVGQMYSKFSKIDTTLEITCYVDTLGKVKLNCSSIKIPQNIEYIKEKNSYSINYKVSFLFDIKSEKINDNVTIYLTETSDEKHKKWTTNKTNSTSFRFNENFEKLGKYNYSLRTITLNNNCIYHDTIINNYKNIGYGTQAFKTIFIPGAGLNKVTGGIKDGKTRTIGIYTLYAIALSSRLYSNFHYNQYTLATKNNSQETLSKVYYKANFSNKVSIITLLIGATWHASSIYDVWSKGNSNKKFNLGKLDVYYNSNTKTAALKTVIKF